MPASTCQVRAQLTVTLVSHRPEYRGHLKEAKQDDVQFNVGTLGRRGISEPVKRPGGQQPVVTKKWGNAHRVKGQSQSKETALHFQSEANEKQLIHGEHSQTERRETRKVHRLEVQTEAQLRQTQDQLYEQARSWKRKFYGLLELPTHPVSFLTAIQKVNANAGRNTPGSDGQRRQDLLTMGYDEMIQQVQQALLEYHPTPVRRVWIEKPGKKEKRPLGIPSVIDRIIQEIVKMVIEPILEAQFFSHSYGLRPMRDAAQSLASVHLILWPAKCTYAVEGDIRAFFDHVNHNILLKKLWKMGIRDKRLLMLIQKMIKAGIMHEIEENALGTPQGSLCKALHKEPYAKQVTMQRDVRKPLIFGPFQLNTFA